MDELSNIREMYNNYTEFSSVVCDSDSDDDEDNLSKPFFQIKPKIFDIRSIVHTKRRDGCYCRVIYFLADGTNLPTGQDLKHLVQLLKRFHPSNAVIVGEEILLPKEIALTYAVLCKCEKLDFAAPTLHSQTVEETLCKDMQTL